MTDVPERELPLAAIARPLDAHRIGVDAEALNALADDIAANGQINAIAVREIAGTGQYEIIAGDRRYQAHELLRRATIRARVYPPDTDPLHIRAAENFQVLSLSPLEEAHVVRRYYERSQSVSATARYLRRSAGWVQSRLDLLAYPDDVREAVSDAGLKLGVAAELAAIEYAPYRRELTLEALRTGATAATAALWRAHYDVDRARIESNHAVVEEIAARREAFVINVVCDGCLTSVAFASTRAWRFCGRCGTELREALSSSLEQGAPGPRRAG